MSAGRTLVVCTVLSVRDGSVFYPYCKGCFSRLDPEQRDTSRCRCSRCGYTCPREQVDYRYRLSLTVIRETCMFGVTVFGSCLTPFFGIHASGLQRLVEKGDGPEKSSPRASEILAQAVKDCFVGRCFVFGIKVTGTESGLWSDAPGLSADRAQFIATQMILPKAAGSEGCTVVRFYQILLQKAAEHEHGSEGSGKTSGPLETPPLRIHCRPSASSFNSSTLSDSGHVLQSTLRSQHQDSTLTPTPPWEQSVGLITSSAEQDEGSGTQHNGEERRSQTDRDDTIHRIQKSFADDRKVRIVEERSPSPLSLNPRLNYRPSFACPPYSSIVRAVEGGCLADTSFSPSQPGHERSLSPRSREAGSSTTQPADTLLSNTLAWEDLPLSESLTEFLDKDHQDFQPVGDEMLRGNRDTSNQHTTGGRASMLCDLTNSPCDGGRRRDPRERACQSNVGRLVNSGEGLQNEKTAVSLTHGNSGQQHEVDAYDCSVDLFSSSIETDADPETEPNPGFSIADELRTRSGKLVAPPSSLLAYTSRANKSVKSRDSFPPPGAKDFDFIPPAQSTPDGQARLPRCGGESAPVWSLTPIRHSRRLTPKRSFRGANGPKKTPPAQRWHLRAQRGSPNLGSPNLGSPRRTNRKWDTSVSDAAACEPEVSEVVAPPIPVAKTQGSRHRRAALASPRKEPAQSGSVDSATVDVGSMSGSDAFPLGDENLPCDWSRDLFSDSA